MSGQLEQFGKYLLLEKLASGGMAEVYLGKSAGASGVNKFVAIKRILPQFSDNQEFIDMFKEEAKIAVNLQNSNVVQIFEFGIERKQFFLVMEYVEGRNLRQIVNELKKNNVQLSIDQIVFIIKEVAAGLDHAHRCLDGSTGKPLNITHRDMSPQNIMISFDGEVKIIDFGIAKAETQADFTKTGTLKGKFGYMSPEQADGFNIDLRTDIFSLGIVLWELLANDRLFTSSSEAAILRKIRDCNIPSIRKINPSIPPELERIVNKSLAKDRSLRYQTSANFHRDLNRFLNTQYPEFSPHDFSIFIKTTFSGQLLEIKKRLIDYAKLQFKQISSSDFTSSGFGAEDTESDFQRGGDEDLGKLDLETVATSEATKVDLDFKNKQQQIRITRPQQVDNMKASATHRSINLNTRPFESGKTSSFLPKVFRFLIWVMVLGGSWMIYSNFKTSKVSPNPIVNQLPVTAPPIQKPIPIEKIKAGEYVLNIESNPSGANIFLDGSDIEKFTPYNIILRETKEYKITLKKDGYVAYDKRMTPDKPASTLNATLLPLPKTAYLNINASNGGENAVVEINGNRLNEKLPIDMYAVPADTDIKVRVFNPVTRLEGEKIVKVQANKRQNVDLILAPDKKNLTGQDINGLNR